MTHYGLEVVEGLTCFADGAVVVAAAHWVVPFGVSEEREFTCCCVGDSVTCLIGLTIYYQLGHVGRNFIVGVEAEGSEVVTTTCCATGEVTEVSSVVTVHVKGDTSACVGVTCREDAAPARRSVINLELGVNLCCSNGNVRQCVCILASLTDGLDVLKRSILVGISKYNLIVSGRNDALLDFDVAEAEWDC